MISDKQKQIMAFPFTDYDALIADGAIRSGKTSFMMLSFVDDAMRRFNNQRFGICGKTVDSTVKNIIAPYLATVWAQERYQIQWRRTDKLLIVSRDGVTNVFEVFGGKDEASFMLIQGRTLAGVLFDEVALQPRSFVEQALARCSVDGSKFWFNCNPESPNHWFYQEWILEPERHNALHLHFQLRDNPALSEKIIARYESMYSGVFYDRYIRGLWVLAEGIIYPMFDDSCTVKPSELSEMTFSHYVISMDYGIQNPTAMLLWGLSGGVWYLIQEYYHSGRETGHQHTDQEYYEALERLAGDRAIDWLIVDPSATSFIALVRQKKRFKVRKANNEVLDGIQKTASALQLGLIKICTGCDRTIGEFGLYSWDPDRDDTPIKENDHCLTGDTLVLTEHGKVPIKELVGTTGKVWSYNEATKTAELKLYTDCRMTMESAEIYEIETENGIIRCTGDHLVLTSAGWKQAKDLTEHDLIVSIGVDYGTVF